jgi:hypothetical protein
MARSNATLAWLDLIGLLFLVALLGLPIVCQGCVQSGAVAAKAVDIEPGAATVQKGAVDVKPVVKAAASIKAALVDRSASQATSQPVRSATKNNVTAGGNADTRTTNNQAAITAAGDAWPLLTAVVVAIGAWVYVSLHHTLGGRRERKRIELERDLAFASPPPVPRSHRAAANV